MASTLELILLFLVAAVAGVVLCRLIKLPPMLGYLAVGILIGPRAMGLSTDHAALEHLAEFGVVFLMFVIGLEFNLPKLKSMRRLVFGLGFSQVTLTILAAVVGNMLVAVTMARFGRTWGLGWQAAVALGGALAMSSTAIVVKLIAETEYKHQVETDIRPFHDVLLGLFFITIGMKLDLLAVLHQWPLVLLLSVLPVLFKFGLVTALAKLYGAATGVALRTGLYLAQAGEF